MKHNLTVIFFLALFFLIFNIYAEPINIEKYNSIIDLIDQGEYEEAIKSGEKWYKKSIKNDKICNQILISAYLSDAYYKWCKFEKANYFANQSYNKFQSVNEKDKEAYYAALILSSAFINQSKFDKAKEIFNQIDSSVFFTDSKLFYEYKFIKIALYQNEGQFQLALNEIDDCEKTIYTFGQFKDQEGLNKKIENKNINTLLTSDKNQKRTNNPLN